MADSLTDALNDPVVGPSNQMKSDTFRRLVALGGVGLLGGAGLRIGQAAGEAFGGHYEPTPAPTESYIRVPVPVGGRRRESPLKAAAAGVAAALRKEAADPPVTPTPPATPGVGAYAADALGAIKPPGGEQSFIGGALFPHNARSAWDMPGVMPLAVAGGTLAAYGGYHAVDSFLDKRHKANTDAELEAARDRYHQTLTGGHKAAAAPLPDPTVPPTLQPAQGPPAAPIGSSNLTGTAETPKTEEDEGAGLISGPEAIEKGAAAKLDLLADKCASVYGATGGAYLTMLGLAGAGAGLATYHYTKEHSPTKGIQDAINRRREQLAAESPTPVLAVPYPVKPDRERQEQAMSSPFGKVPKFASSLASSADAVLGGLRERRQFYQNQMLTAQNGGKPPGGKAPAKPAPPAPPQLPSVVNKTGG